MFDVIGDRLCLCALLMVLYVVVSVSFFPTCSFCFIFLFDVFCVMCVHM